MAGDQKTIGIRIGDQNVPTSAYVNRALLALEERLGKRLDALAEAVDAVDKTVLGIERRLHRRIETLERPPVGTAVTHNRVSRIEERVAELAGRVQSLEAAPVTGPWVATSGTRYVTVTEEKWQLIEQVLEKSVAWHGQFVNFNLLGEARGLWDAVDAYRKQADQ